MTIFKNFKGLSSRLKFCTGEEESEVPRDVSLMRENCWIDVRPRVDASTQTMLKNYGTDPGNFQMKQKVESQWSLYTMMPINSKSSNFTTKINKIKSQRPKFDGLACSDGMMAFRFLNSYSSAAFKTISLDD